MSISQSSRDSKTSCLWHCNRVRTWLDRPLTAWLLFAVSLVVTLFAWQLSDQHVRERSADRFALRTAQLQERIADRLLEYEQALRGGIGLFASSKTVSRDEWHTYVKNCEIDRYFPGLQCMGYAVAVAADSIPEHELKIRAEGFSEYYLHPIGDREKYTSIVFVEPFDWRNKRAIGYDMYSEPIRRRAMDRAIDTGQPAVSGKVTLVQETKNEPQNGFLYYLPFYRHGADLKTKQDRREAHEGFVFAAFRANDLMQQIIRQQEDSICFAVYDAESTAPESLLFDSHPQPASRSDKSANQLSVDLPLDLRGRRWTIHFETLDGFIPASDHLQSHTVAVGGIVVDLLLFFAIGSIGKQKRRALTLARQMTEDMRESEELTRSVLKNATEAIITVNVDGKIRMFNEAAESMFLQTADRAAGENFHWLLFQLDWEQALQCIKESPSGSMMVKCQRSTGEVFPCQIALGRVSTEKQFCYIITARDETARIEAEEKMAEINQQLIDASHKSGMSEVVTGVLHNVGNILNSLKVSSGIVADKLRGGHVPRLRKAADILLENQSDLVTFLTESPQGQQFVNYLDQLSDKLLDDRDLVEEEIENVQKNIEHISHVIQSQQQNAGIELLNREENIAALMDDACQIVSGRNVDFKIQIVRGYQECPRIRSDRHKILQILINLIKNAQDAVGEIDERPRVIRLSVQAPNKGFVQLIVKDNGIGMTRAQLKKVLTFGFTTKPEGHGFGLHSCLNAAVNLGGEIAVESPGPGLGSKFTLTLPVTPAAKLPARTDYAADKNEQLRLV